MKKTFLAIVCAFGSMTVFAQVESSDEVTTDTTSSTQATVPTSTDATTSDSQVSADNDTAGVSEEDLRKYAIVMDSINSMKKSLLKEMGDMVKNNESITNARYNDLSKAIGDEDKLKELDATAEELAFVQSVTDRKNEGAKEISETFQTLAKDYIGVETYNEVKDAIASDSELKARYDEILAEVESGADSASAK